MLIAVTAESSAVGPPGSGGLEILWQDTAAAAQVAQVAQAVQAMGPQLVDDPGWTAAARQGWANMPVGLRSRLTDFRRHSGSCGTLLVRGLPVDEPSLPPTPGTAMSVQRRPSIPAAILTTIACGLGDPIAYAAEKSGALVQDVVPVPGAEEAQGNAGSVRLSFHTENAFHPHRPDYVLLLCLRADRDGQAALQVACSRIVVPLLSDASRALLASPQFVTAPPQSFGAGSDTLPSPVLSGAAGDPDLRVDMAATRALRPDAAAALAELAEQFQLTARAIKLLPGDLAIVDNRVAVHGRSPFRPRYDGRDRWLQRTFVCADLRRSLAWRADDGHVLDSERLIGQHASPPGASRRPGKDRDA